MKNLMKKRSRTSKVSEIAVPPATEGKPIARPTLRNTSAKELQNRRDRLVGLLKANGFNHHDAENAAQDALSKGLDVQNLRNPEAWLFETAINGAYSVNRKMKTATKHKQAVGYHAERIRHNAVVDPVAKAIRSEETETLSRIMAEALATLTDLDREILKRKYDTEATYEEIAEQLGLSHAAVKARVSRGRKRLRHFLGSRRHRRSGTTP